MINDSANFNPIQTIQVENWLEDFIFNTILVIMTKSQILVNQIACSEITCVCVGTLMKLEFYLTKSADFSFSGSLWRMVD